MTLGASEKVTERYEQLKKIIDSAEVIKALYKAVDDVRLRAGKVIVLSSHRIGLELIKMPKAKGTRLAGRSVGGNTKLLPKETTATLAELAGYKMKGHRLKKLAEQDQNGRARGRDPAAKATP